MPEEYYDTEFPNLGREGWQRTSEPANYNCIAFAAGDLHRFWWPNLYAPEPSDDYWPTGVPNEETVAAFVSALATRGFTPCADGEMEAGFEKLALYALHGTPKHAAVQQPNGRWRSKLGPHEDVETTLQGLVGPCYGDVVQFLRRPQQVA